MTSILKKYRISTTIGILISLTTVFTSMSMVNFASATTTSDQTTIDTLAQQLVTDSLKVHDGGTAQTLAQPVLSVLSAPGFDWNEVMFGTDSLSASQSQASAALTSTVQQLSTFDLMTTSAATSAITNAVTELQTLNTNVAESDALSFISSMVNNGPSTMLSLLGVPSSQYAQTLHSTFASELSGSSAAIQAVFSLQGPNAATSTTTAVVSGGAGGGAVVDTATTTPTTTTTTTSPTGSQFQTTLTTQSVSTSGSQMTTTDGNSQVLLVIPASAFSQAEQVGITGEDPSSVQINIPSDMSAITAVGVTFSGAAPTQPITLTIQNAGITQNSQVYKLNQGTLTPVQATVTNGQAVITFTSDPDFIIATPTITTTTTSTPSSATNTTSTTGSTTYLQGGSTGASSLPKMKKYQRAILLNGHYEVIPALVRHKTTFMPIWYLGYALKQIGYTYYWNGKVWRITTPATVKLDRFKSKPGKGTMGIELNGTLVERVTGIVAQDPNTNELTTYMPIWYLMQALKRVGVSTTWNGKVFGFTNIKQY